jgi:hypothetical protein
MEKGAIPSAPLKLSSIGVLPRIHRGTQDVRFVAVFNQLNSDITLAGAQILPGLLNHPGKILPGSWSLVFRSYYLLIL